MSRRQPVPKRRRRQPVPKRFVQKLDTTKDHWPKRVTLLDGRLVVFQSAADWRQSVIDRGLR